MFVKKQFKNFLMTPYCRDWDIFIFRLKDMLTGQIKYNPDHLDWSDDFRATRYILQRYFYYIDIEPTLDYFQNKGAYADAQVIHVVESVVRECNFFHHVEYQPVILFKERNYSTWVDDVNKQIDIINQQVKEINVTKNNETEELDEDTFDIDLALTPFNDEWDDFIIKLNAMIKDPKTYEIKDLDADDPHGVAIYVLRKYFPSYDLNHTLNFFMYHGGYDSMEVILNVQSDFDHMLQQMEEEAEATEKKKKAKTKKKSKKSKDKVVQALLLVIDEFENNPLQHTGFCDTMLEALSMRLEELTND